MTPEPAHQVDPRESLAVWLRAGRAQRKLSLEEVAKITKIQARILEKIEAGELDGLPAEVFVRGFVRSFAKCVGLDEAEALDRLGECRNAGPQASAAARAFVQTMVVPKVRRPVAVAEPVAVTEPVAVAEPVAVTEPVAVAVTESVAESVAASDPVTVPEAVADAVAEAVSAEPAKKKRTRKKAAGTTPPPRARRKKKDTSVEAIQLAEGSAPVEAAQTTTIAPAAVAAPVDDELEVDITVTEPWTPTMPPITTAPPVPWRRATSISFLATTTTSASIPAPSLVIDDADPDRAERMQSQRSKDHRVSFLPPILLDREDRSQRQGGLTLAVIILLIAATLTLSYLMRRPTVTGDGVTIRDVPATLA